MDTPKQDYDVQKIKSAKLAWLAFVANTGRRISTYEREYYARKANLDVLAATSPELTDEIKSRTDEIYDWALAQEFIAEKPFETAPGHATVMCTLTPKGYEHLERFAHQGEQPQKLNQAEQPLALMRAAKAAAQAAQRSKGGPAGPSR